MTTTSDMGLPPATQDITNATNLIRCLGFKDDNPSMGSKEEIAGAYLVSYAQESNRVAAGLMSLVCRGWDELSGDLSHGQHYRVNWISGQPAGNIKGRLDTSTANQACPMWQPSSASDPVPEPTLPPACEVAYQLLETVPQCAVVQEYYGGFGGRSPDGNAIRSANRLVAAIQERAVEFEVYFDDSDGALGFMARLQSGLLLLAEQSVDGVLSGGVYDDLEAGGEQKEFFTDATVDQFFSLL